MNPVEHTFGVSLYPSTKYKDLLNEIANDISKNKTVKEVFGKTFLISPDNVFFVIPANPTTDSIILIYNEGPEPVISLTVKHQFIDENKLNDVVNVVGTCISAIKKWLDVEVIRIGCIQNIMFKVENPNKIVQEHFFRDFLDDYFEFNGGSCKFIYIHKPDNMPELNIGIKLDTLVSNDALLFGLDVNNREKNVDLGDNFIDDLAKYSRDLFNTKLVFKLKEKGIQ